MNNFFYFLVPLILINSQLSAERKIYIIPPGGYENEKLFDLNDPILNRDNCIKPYFDLKENIRKIGLKLITVSINDDLSDGEFIITHDISQNVVNMLSKYPSKKLLAIILEPPIVTPNSYNTKLHSIFSKIFIMDDNFVDGKKYIKFFYPQPALKMINNIIPFKEKKFCTLISGNKYFYDHYDLILKEKRYTYYELYSERKKTIEFFEQYPNDFTFYGKYWNNSYKNYGGPIEKKVDVLKNYKFCICFENTINMPGYITEKIFDSFHAGCIPIYLGAPNITDYIPNDCFIDFRNFKNYENLYKYLKNMKEDEYYSYISNIKNFLSSPKGYKFSTQYFVDLIVSNIQMSQTIK
jgi:alpha(1,3/1,4) fucosyltransferase